MEITLEGTRFGLLLLLLLSGCFMLMSLVFVILSLTDFFEQPPMSRRKKVFLVPGLFGGVLFSAGWEVLAVTQLFDFTFQYRDPCIVLMIISGVSLWSILLSTSALTSPGRTITKCASFLSAMLFLCIFILSSVGLIDLLYFWTAGGTRPGFFASFLRLETWGARGVGLLFGGTMLGCAFALATASLAPVDIQHGNSRYSARFKGASPALRKASKITASAVCLLAALCGFGVFFDVASASVDVIRKAGGFDIAWALLLFAAGVLAYSAASEKEWVLLSWVLCISGCLAVLIAVEQFHPSADYTVVVQTARTALDVEEAVGTIFETGKFFLVVAFLLIVGGALVSDYEWVAAAAVLCFVGVMFALVDWEAPMRAWQVVTKLLN